MRDTRRATFTGYGLPSLAVLTGRPVGIRPDPSFQECPLCSRRNLMDENAFWNHLRMRHRTEIMGALSGRAVTPKEMDERIEDALIRIVNSTSLDEATEIATVALLGG